MSDLNTDHIAAQLQHLAVPLADLTLDPKNARVHDERNLDSIRGSLKRFKQRMPIVVQAQGMLVRAGNGRVQAALAEGWDCLAAVVVDEGEAEAVAFALADNRTAELATWDFGVLAGHLDALQADLPDFDLDPLWDVTELEALALPSFWDDKESPEGGEDGGDGKRTDRDLFAIKFTQEQVRELQAAADAAGMTDATDPATVVAMVKRGSEC
jgi:hypothetical protein